MAFNDWKLDDGRVIRLYTIEEFKILSPKDTVIDIFGEVTTAEEVRSRNDHTETRGGYLAYGLEAYEKEEG